MLKFVTLSAALSVALNSAVLSLETKPAASSETQKNASMKLVFKDDFDGPAVNQTHWKIVEGDGCPTLCGFGNNEKQAYSADTKNLRIEDGILMMEAHPQPAGSTSDYSSAKITTENMPGWTYGRFEYRAKLPKGVGTWPAFWMLPDETKFGGWPKSGEIDIMEHVGHDEGVVHGTIHTEAFNHKIGTQKGKSVNVDTATDGFHVYAMEWDAAEIRWYMDGKQYHSFKKVDGATYKEWPFDDPFHLIINLAVGGMWGGEKGIDKNAFPARYEIDWVKVYQ